MNEQELDALLRRVLQDAGKQDGASGDAAEAPFAPSLRHRRQIRAMLRDPLGWARRKQRPLVPRLLRRVAVAMLAVVLCCGLVLAVSPDARAAVIRWTVEQYGTYLVYRYTGTAQHDRALQYEITMLPAGYMEAERGDFGTLGYVEYRNADGDIISLDYNYMQEGAVRILSEYGYDVTKIRVAQMEGLLQIPHDPTSRTTITWLDEQGNVQLKISAMLDAAELILMAESVAEKTD